MNLNLLIDLQKMWRFEFMQHAFEAGTIVAVIAGITGYFVVLRRSAFTAHAFSEIGFAGAAGAVLLSIQPIVGLLVGSTLGALAIAALGRRAANRDTQIGIVLAFALGLGLLFISLYSGYASEAYSILFGEILGVGSDAVIYTLLAGALILASVGVLYRPLLFASLDEDVAEAKGMPMLLIGTAFLLIVAVAVSFAVQVTGVLLIFSLMVTPGATAQYLSRRPQRAILISVEIALIATVAGIFVAYYTPYPVSFFITGLVFGLYLLVRGLYSLAETRALSAPAGFGQARIGRGRMSRPPLRAGMAVAGAVGIYAGLLLIANLPSTVFLSDVEGLTWVISILVVLILGMALVVVPFGDILSERASVSAVERPGIEEEREKGV